MPSAAHHADAVDGQILHHQHRLGAAVAAGLQHLQGVHIVQGQQLRGNGAVHIQNRPRHVGGVILRGQRADLAAEFRNVGAGNGKARGQLMAAVAFQQRRQGAQGGKQVEAPVAAGAGFAVLAVQTDQEGGAGVFLGNAAGHDAHHALMPAFIRQHDGLRGLAHGQHGHGLPVNFRLHGLPLPVQLAQSPGGLGGLVRVVGEKQLHRKIDLSHPSGGVDAGRQHEADGGRADSFRGAAALRHQRRDARALGMRQRFQTSRHEHPVLPLQGHHIRHGAEAYHVGVFFQHRFLRAAQGRSQLEGHAHAGEILMGIAAVGAVGVYHGNCGGQRLLALMMVGDDEINAQLLTQLRLAHGGDAAVHGDDQLDALGVELVDSDGIQAVALLQTAGNVAHRVGAVAAEKIRQQAGGGDAVHVVVAEHGDLLTPGHGKSHPSGSLVHIRHQKRVKQGRVAV